MLKGLLELKELNLYGNKISAIHIPKDAAVLCNLQKLNVGYNDLYEIPEEIQHLKALKKLRLPNNFLEKVPRSVCEMRNLVVIDVASNPVIQPPDCDSCLHSMRYYYRRLAQEEERRSNVDQNG